MHKYPGFRCNNW